ncbi:MAG TPA: alpha/beta fold hydrolase [Gemmatimonadaceae bacterium]|nr:alpha/beta fold hydrolase [Gemmatimonadaceae bacterium]
MRHDLTLHVPGYDIPAALDLPGGERIGGVLLVPGSLFSDVNGDYPAWNVFPHVYGHLAQQMAVRGLAVFRFAKLGPGTGSVETDAAQAKAIRNWPGRMRIARAALEAFRAALRERGAAVPRFVLAGHSEGAVVVSALGREGVDADGIVLLSGPSVGILGIMIEQVRAMTAPGGDGAALATLEAVVACIRKGEAIPDELRTAASGPFGAGALIAMPPDGLTYMRECDAVDPVATIAAVGKPVLIIQGGRDSSVPPHHADRLRAGRVAQRTAYSFFPELQHMYKNVPMGTPDMEAFGFPGETDPRVADAIADWTRTL